MYRPDQYLAVIVGVMFILGVVLIFRVAQQRSKVRERWEQVPRRREAVLNKDLRDGLL